MSVRGVTQTSGDVGTARPQRVVENAAASTPTIQMIQHDEDRTRWGPVWGGFFTTAASFLLLETLLIWIGAVGLHAGKAGAVTTDRPWVTWLIALGAFFLGGIVTAMTNPVRGMFANAINGMLVWALASTIFVGISIVGAGAIFGTLGTLITDLRTTGSVHIAGSTLTSDAGWAFLTLITTAAAAMIGGAIAGIGGPIGWVSREPTYVAADGSGINTSMYDSTPAAHN